MGQLSRKERRDYTDLAHQLQDRWLEQDFTDQDWDAIVNRVTRNDIAGSASRWLDPERAGCLRFLPTSD